MSVQKSSQSKSYMETITKKVNVDNPRKIFMTEVSVENQFKLDETKVKCIRDYYKTGANHAISKIEFPPEDKDALDRILSWWQQKSQN